jgi:hypothetical protein
MVNIPCRANPCCASRIYSFVGALKEKAMSIKRRNLLTSTGIAGVALLGLRRRLRAAEKASATQAVTPGFFPTQAELSSGIPIAETSHPPLDVRRYGIDTAGKADVTSMLNRVFSLGGRIWCGDQTILRVDGPLLLDIAKTSLAGTGVVFDMSNGGTLQVYSSTDAAGRVRDNWTHKIEGIHFRGGGGPGHTMIVIGRAGNEFANSSEICFEKCSFALADVLVAFTHNAWRTHFSDCGFEQPNSRFLSFPRGLSNAGEVMQFDHCWFGLRSADLYLDAGHWLFNGCSFGIAATIRGVGDARLDLFGCNLEAQPCAGYRMIRLGGTCNCNVHGGQVVINLGANFAVAPFLLESSDCALSFHGTHLPLGGRHLQFQNDAAFKLRHLVVGPGRVGAQSCASYALSSLNAPANNVQFAKAANRLTNGDAEYGNENGWRVAGGSSKGTAAAASASPLNGSRHFRLIAPDPDSPIVLTQDTPASDAAGRLCVFSYAVKVVTGAGTVSFAALRFLDGSGNPIASADRSDTVPGSVTSYSQRAIVGHAPPGTAAIRVQVDAQTERGRSIVDFDELCLCVL